MNKHLITLAVAAATLSSGTVSAAQVYSNGSSTLNIGGRIEARGLLQNEGKTNFPGPMTKEQKDKFKDLPQDELKQFISHFYKNQKVTEAVSDQSRVRLNIEADTNISNGLQGIARFDREFTSGYEDDYNRYMYVGVKSDSYGQLVYGTGDGSLDMVTDFTNIMQYAGGVVAVTKLPVAHRPGNNLAYVGTFDNLTFAANYVFAGASYDGNNNKTDVNGFSTGAVYNVGKTGLSLGVGYAQQKGQNGESRNGNQTFVAASYTMGNLYFAGMYKYGHHDGYGYTDYSAGSYYPGNNPYDTGAVNTEGYELAASYTMGKYFFTTSYGYLRYDENNVAKEAKDMANQLAFDCTYNVTNNFYTYASYMFNFLDSKYVGRAAATDQFVLGAGYDF